MADFLRAPEGAGISANLQSKLWKAGGNLVNGAATAEIQRVVAPGLAILWYYDLDVARNPFLFLTTLNVLNAKRAFMTETPLG